MTLGWPRALILLGTALVLGAVNFAIVGKERIRHGGEIVYLALAPVDPRSLMQGDYMTLRFALVRAIEASEEASATTAPAAAETPLRREGETAHAAVWLDAKRIGSLAAAGAPETLKLRYRIRNGQIWLGTNAFFFEEGTAARFEGAAYGEFRVDPRSGEAVLVGLRGPALEAL